MPKTRLIARLDIKGPHLVKGIQLEGLRKLGDPHAFARRYYDQGIDEILYMDIVASLYQRNSLLDVMRATTADVFIPITVGGGIRTIDDVVAALRAGADKVAINTAAIKRPELIAEVARTFGSQCVVLGIEAKRHETHWEAYYDNGRERTGVDVLEWARRACELGAGEVLLTSVDSEGLARGYDFDLVRAVAAAVPVPVIASGGMGSVSDAVRAVRDCGASAVAMAHVLHYNRLTVEQVRRGMAAAGVAVRPAPQEEPTRT